MHESKGNPGMDSMPSLDDLLTRFHERQQRGQTMSLEELGAGSPEQLEALRQRLQAVAAMESFLAMDSSHRDSTPTKPTKPAGKEGGLAHAERRSEASRLPTALPGYEVLGELGRGGMGVVYKARQVRLKRLVALKMIQAGRGAGPEQVARFRTEAQAVARLQHPNIVHVYETAEHDGLPYFSMEYVEGGRLDRKLAGTPLPARDAARLVETLARAMDYAHQRDILHRDLKPANVLLATDGTPKITDFGLAKRLEEDLGHTQTGSIFGTPPYMAPEQAEGRQSDVSPATDVYALGAILYECLTGRPPFQAASILETLEQVRTQESVPPRRLQPRVPRELDTIALKCLQKEPKNRYPGAQALAEDLRRFLNGEPIRARPVTLADRAIKWVRRRPALAAAYCLLVLTVVFGGLGGGAAWLWLRAEEAREQLAGEKKRSEELFYLRQVGMAHGEWQAGDVARAEQLLQKCPNQERGWEWRFVHRLCHADLYTLRARTGGMSGVVFSPDGQRIASALADGTVRVWDAASYREVLCLPGHKGPLCASAFSPDGTHIAGVARDGTVILWDAKTGEQIISRTGGAGPVCGVAFSRDGRYLASWSDDRTAGIRDARTGRKVCTLRGHIENVTGVAFSPDGQRLATASQSRREEGAIKLWDTGTGRELYSFRPTSRINRIAFSPDGRQLAGAGNDQSVRVWDAENGREVRALWGHTNRVQNVAFSADGKRLASCGDDHLVRVWEVATWRELFSLRGHQGPVGTVAFSPDGTRLASASNDGTIKLWDGTGGQPAVQLQGHGGMLWGVCFSPGGQRLVSAGNDGTVKVWDVRTRRLVRSISAHYGAANCVTFSPDGQLLASGGQEGLVKLWDAKTGALVLGLRRGTGQVHSIALSPGGRLLASASVAWDVTNQRYVPGEIKVRDLQTCKEAFALATENANGICLAFSPDGKRLACGGQGSVTVCEVPTGRTVFSVAGHEDLIVSVAFSPDGQRLATASWDKTVKLWDAVTGRRVLTLKGHTARVTSVAFNPDGQRLASGSDDHTIRLFTARSGEEVLSLSASVGPVHCLAFSPDGHRLASGGWDRIVRIWDASPVEPGYDPDGCLGRLPGR
jgi:WD40 repeat protein/serine/threonine protein kinase